MTGRRERREREREEVKQQGVGEEEGRGLRKMQAVRGQYEESGKQIVQQYSEKAAPSMMTI